MKRGHSNLQRDREEQLQLRGQLTNVYNKVHDLGVRFKMIEIPGCSFITIGRSEHKYSHLDENLTQQERSGISSMVNRKALTLVMTEFLLTRRNKPSKA